MKNTLNIFILQFSLCHLVHASHLSGAGEHYVAIRSVKNDRWVAAEQRGRRFLTANRNDVGAWETFRIFCHTANCSEISLMSYSNQ